MKSFLLLYIVAGFFIVSANSEENELRKGMPGFLFIMPKVLYAGRNETCCISTKNANIDESTLQISVELKVKNKYYITTHSLNKDFGCLKIPVPMLIDPEPKSISVRAQANLNGINYAAYNLDPVMIYPAKDLVFIETDRRIYKSGDVVKIRIISFEPTRLTPITNKGEKHQIRSVYIRNPLDIAVVLWQNVTTQMGMVQLEYHLSNDPIEGKWRIQVDDDNHKIFDVGKYTLPRFKIDINYPKTLLLEPANHSNISITYKICSKYSYGGNVKGAAFIRLTPTNHLMVPVQQMKPLYRGCVDFVLTANELGLTGHLPDKNTLQTQQPRIDLTATVTEYGTDRIELTTARTLILSAAYKIEFEAPDVFQPGLAYTGRVHLVPVVDVYRANADVDIEICYTLSLKRSWNLENSEKGSGGEHCANFTNQSINDTIIFDLPPLKPEVVHIQLYAHSLTHPASVDGASMLVVRLYATHAAYLRILPIPATVNCSKTKQVTVEYTIDTFRHGELINFYYLVKSRGRILQQNQIKHYVYKSWSRPLSNNQKIIIDQLHKYTKPSSLLDRFEFEIKELHSIDSFTNKYQLLVYYITNKGEIIANTIELKQDDQCFMHKNNVRATWWSGSKRQEQAIPGQSVSLMIDAFNNRYFADQSDDNEILCAISAIDYASEFLENNIKNHFSSDELIKSAMQEKSATQSSRRACITPTKRHRNVIVASLTDNGTISSEDTYEESLDRVKRYVYSYSEDYDAYDVFENYGVTLITNFKLITKHCYTGPPPKAALNSGVQFLMDQYNAQDDEKLTQIRSFFPETWLWEVVPVKGTTIITRELPHTITKWPTNVMCVSSKYGVGFAESATLEAFQPFFVDVITPYSIKRAETLYLHVVIFNYNAYNLPIRVSLGNSQGLKLADYNAKKSVSFCVPQNDSVTHVYELIGTETGLTNVTVLAELDAVYPGVCGPDTIINKRDVVSKLLLIEPEGRLLKIIKSAMLCGDNGFDSVNWSVDLPHSVIENTLKAKLTVNADLLGKTIEHLEELISLPTGCGEQIMSALAPNLYVLRYLNATWKLTPSIRQRAIRNLKIGYQRILNYAHQDGSFSAFGYHDPAGSMFLTAFVVRTLKEIRKFIYVDQRVINRAVNWILANQLENGCFNAMYHVFQDMGGTSTENSTAGLTSYVMLSLYEAGVEIPERVEENAKYCIRGHHSVFIDKYTLAISAYALLKIKWYTEADRMLKKLDQLANRSKDSMLWWTLDDQKTKTADVETTAYVLQALLQRATVEDLSKSHAIARWLTTKISGQGAFFTSQDTSVALDALAKYATFLDVNRLNLNVTISANQKVVSQIKVKADDRLRSKKLSLGTPNNVNNTKRVDVLVFGTGCVLVQYVVQCYMPDGSLLGEVALVNSTNEFVLDVEVESVSNVDKCSVLVLSVCVAYNFEGVPINMAMLEVELPSGYRADRASLYQLVDTISNLKMFEEVEDKVNFYFTKLGSQQKCVAFNINQNVVVKSHFKSMVKLYDYYKPDKGIAKFYSIGDKCDSRTKPIFSDSFDLQMNDTLDEFNKFETVSIENATSLN